jgi:6-phosphogluconolactonase
MATQILSFASDAELAQAAARAFLDWAMTRHGRTTAVALAGGRITGSFYDAIVAYASPEQRAAVQGLDFFWGDERCVPPNSADSNFKLAQDRLFSRLEIPEQRQHRVRGELPPSEAAAQIAGELTQLATKIPGQQPQIDLVLLGMGEDGHVASLFPNAPVEVLESRAIYLPVIGPKPPPQRISLSYWQLHAAAEVWVLVAGAGKLAPLRDALSGACSDGLGRMLGGRRETKIFESVGHGSR